MGENEETRAEIISMGQTPGGPGLPGPRTTCGPTSLPQASGEPKQPASTPEERSAGTNTAGAGGICPGPGLPAAPELLSAGPAPAGETPKQERTEIAAQTCAPEPVDGKKSKLAKAGRKNFAAVYLTATAAERAAGGEAGKIVEFTDQEALVLSVFLDKRSYAAAATEAGVTVDSVKRMLRRPNLRRYLDEVITKAAVLQGVDKSWLLKEMVGVWEGRIKPTKEMMDAAKLVEKVIAPRGPGVQVNVQQNSIYGGMSKAETEAAWAARREIAGGNV